MLFQKFRKVEKYCLCVGKWGSVLIQTDTGLSKRALQRGVLELCQRRWKSVLHCRYFPCCRTTWFFSVSQSSVTGSVCCWACQLYKIRWICCLCIILCVFVLSVLTVNATCTDFLILNAVPREDSDLKAKLLLSTEWTKGYSWSFLWQFSENLLDEIHLWAADFGKCATFQHYRP